MSKDYNSLIVNNCINEFQKGNKLKAFNNLNNYINNNPKDYKAIYNFALMAESIGKIELAIKNYLKVNKIDKNNWRSRFNLYLIYINQKNYQKAFILINNVLRINPGYQPALRDKALVYYYQNRPDEGKIIAEESIKLNEKDYIAYNILGLNLGSLKMHKEAKNIFLKAIKINPKYFASYNNLGNCLNHLKEQKLALKNFEKALELKPDFHEAINNIANIYSVTGKYNRAIKFYEQAIKKGGDISKINYNIGVAYLYLGNLKKAEKYYNIAYKINPDDQLLHKNLSILYLAQQKYNDAWKFFDGRLHLDEFVSKNSNISNIRNKLWKGEKINKNEKILIIKEQGIGDEIIYSSMYVDLLKEYPNAIIETEKRLLSIFKRSFHNNNNFVAFNTFSKNKQKIKSFKKILYAGSLGRLFRNRISDFPKKNYLHVEKDKLKKIKKKLDNINNNYKIGITWNSKREVIGEDKSISLDLLEPILKIKELTFINLQYGEVKKDIEEYYKKGNKNIIHEIEEVDLFNDFESISALLKSLDLFITVSNSTAHLAGALGVPTFLIKPKNHALFHYWNQPEDKTPWYPSIKLFNYKNGWDKTIKEVRSFLLKKFNISN